MAAIHLEAGRPAPVSPLAAALKRLQDAGQRRSELQEDIAARLGDVTGQNLEAARKGDLEPQRAYDGSSSLVVELNAAATVFESQNAALHSLMTRLEL